MYLIGKILLSLGLAFALGFGTAWLAWFVSTRRREDEVTAVWQRRFADLQRERDQALTGLNRELDEARQQVPTLEKSLAERSDLIAQLEDDLAQWREKLPPLQTAAAEREARIETLQRKLAERDRQNAALARERDALGKTAAAASPAAAAAPSQAAWDALRARVKRAEVELESANARASEFETTTRELAEELNAALVAEKAKAREALAASNAQVERLQDELAELKAGAANAQSGASTLPRGVAPSGLIEQLPAGRTPDDLKKIRGIGPVLERTLNQLGIYFFAQIAALSPDEIDWVTFHLDTFPGRIERDEWVAQAARLAR